MRKLKFRQLAPGEVVEGLPGEVLVDDHKKLLIFAFKSDDADESTMERIKAKLNEKLGPKGFEALVFVMGSEDSLDLYEVD